ncbi:uncharacterized protein LOC126338601 isoform X2 [Schistocerca gregaria]|uniref:uncharacterized protein LOC126338601 isoform X2 n=1 Tax=Schistocerca gregaria TaxID=7010 RepID=UPI00211EE210|nr:uncharacterized protein LOC126338601 isoform X2 [Schistocerca gregaria]
MDPGSSSSSSSSICGRQSRCDRRQLWHQERLSLLRTAQDNVARQRQQAELRRLTDKLLGALTQLEVEAQPPPSSRGDTEATAPVTPPTAAPATPAATVSPPASRSSWVRDQLELLADLDLIEH